MAQAVVMPKLGQTVEEAVLVKWHKHEGEKVKKGDVLFEIETDKAVLEAESFFDGTLLKVLVNEGDTVPVSSTVAFVGKPGEALAMPTPTTDHGPRTTDTPQKKEEAAVKRAPLVSVESARVQPAPTVAVTATPPLPAPGRLFISPRAKALALACIVDPANIPGTGPNGRIVEKDVRAYLEANSYDRIRITPAAKNLAGKERIDILQVKPTGTAGRITVQDVERAVAEKPKKMSRMRQVIAKRLTDSFTTTPHYYVTVSADMTDLLAFRSGLKEKGEVYSVTDFILEAVVLSLLEFPTLNSVTDGQTVRWHGSVDLGMAVALEEGLVVPVIRNADDLNMKELHDAAVDLAVKAREGRLVPDEMTGSTFTVSNMGMMDVENFTAIINPGESAILAVASTMEKVVSTGGKITTRSMMKMTLSSDHRIVDGMTGANFVNAIKEKLEDVELWKSLTL